VVDEAVIHRAVLEVGSDGAADLQTAGRDALGELRANRTLLTQRAVDVELDRLDRGRSLDAIDQQSADVGGRRDDFGRDCVENRVGADVAELRGVGSGPSPCPSAWSNP
jgi:hypothetical protein